MNSEGAKLEQISAFQARLLDVLHAGGTADEMRAKLATAAEAAQLTEYVRGFDDRMLLVASELVRKWGGRLH